MPLGAVTDLAARPTPVVLLILDGWGLSPAWGGNAIGIANPPTFNYLWAHYPHTVLQTFQRVRAPDGSVGSSEIGHASLGSGRIVAHELTEINLLIGNGQFFENEVLQTTFQSARDARQSVHLIGLLSEGGIHGSTSHAQALVRMAKQQGVERLFLHPIIDGRDSTTYGALNQIEQLEHTLHIEGIGQIATLLGRFYGLDRDQRWDRTEVALQALVSGSPRHAPSPQAALATAYREGFDDEHLPPTIIAAPAPHPSSDSRIRAGDSLIFWNFRADRARQLVQALLDPQVLRRFGFFRKYPVLPVRVATMTDYHLPLPGLMVAYPRSVIESTLGQLLANHSFTQLHVAESEKSAHVTYFFNGGRVEPYPAEDRIIVRSPRVLRYDTVPAMSAATVTKVVEQAITRRSHDFIVANYANVDLLGHTGNLAATVQAVLVVDEALRRIANAIISVGGVLMVTADHGNAESVVTLVKGDRETLHSANPVPFIYVASAAKRASPVQSDIPARSVVRSLLQTDRTLADVAPTILELFGIPKPSDMTGTSLTEFLE
ncbi:2,3-bisphosphoglycerate-independent phosphoglycerate mutase [Candidatus Berkelbacteria bacterium]|nr:2,3-bisphosphoglycerate-independent phosphoglycerate mutase [Candidatus Berkelbacteria bacterium]